MRSVITLPSQKKAVIDIPYSKLLPPTALEAPTHEHQWCESKIVVSGTASKRANADLKRMVEELEQAYDREVKDLTAKAGQLEAEKAAIVLNHSREISRITDEFSVKAASYEKQLQALRESNVAKDGELRRLSEQKEIILRNKISEFRQQEYIGRITEQEQIIRFKDLQLKELLAKLEMAQLDKLRLEDQKARLEEQKARLEEQALASRLKLEAEISRLSFDLTETSKRFVAQQSNISFASKLKDQDSLKLTQELKYQLQLVERSLRESELASDAKTKLITSLTETSKEFERKTTQLEAQAAAHKKTADQLWKEKAGLTDLLNRSRQAVSFLDQEKGGLLLQLADRLADIDKLRVQLASKERVYEVKVERVIDGRDQIEQLQAAVFELEQQMKLLAQDKDFLAQDLRKRQAQVDELATLKIKLEGEIAGLKAYISKREGSFRWTVEREIEKDIAASGQRPQLYKVSQVGEYTREAQGNANRVIAQQVALNLQANLFGSYPQEIYFEQEGGQ